MKTSKISFNGKITTRTLNPVSGKTIIKNFRTKKQDDVLLLQLAKNLVPPEPFKWQRTTLNEGNTKELDILLERILKLKLPDESYVRSMSTPTNSFLYLIVHCDAYAPNNPHTLINDGIAIDFVG